MGLETSTYIDGLVVTNPVGSSDTKAQGDDHLRLLKSTIKATFPNLTGAVTSDQTELNHLDGATGVTGTGNTVRSASPTFSGTVTAETIAANAVSGTLSGNGVSITALNATQLTSGSVPDARVPSSNVTQHNASITARNITGKTGIAKTLSTSVASGGADGDIWYRY